MREKIPAMLYIAGMELVPKTGLEPAYLAVLRPEHSASTNFATWA